MDSSIDSKWTGHVEFAKWLVKEIEPNNVLDLGTYEGQSAIALSEYKKANVYTVDKKIKAKTKKLLDSKGIAWKESLFKDMVDEVEDRSIDILHIDGSHLMEDVTEDAELFVPKIANGGVLLMHDVWNPSFYGPISVFSRNVNGYKLILLNSNGLGVATMDLDLIHKIMKKFEYTVTGDCLNYLLLYIERKNLWIKALSESSVREQVVKDLNIKTDLLSTAHLLPSEQSSS